MNRRAQLLLGISATVGVTLLLAWILVQALVIRPAIGEREPARIQQVLDAAELMRSGMSAQEIEARRGIDIRLFHGEPDGPPPGGGWTRQDTERGVVWKRKGGRYEIAAWTGRTWVVLQEHLPYATTFALALLAAGLPVIVLMFGLSRPAQRRQELAEASLARMAAGNLAERLDEEAGNAELRRVAVAVNRMASQLQALIESDRRRMAGLSHELRTPLTRIRLELEMARREGASVERLDRVEKDIEAFDAMVTEMLDLSRLQLVGEQMVTREAVDLADLAQRVVDEEGLSAVEVSGSGTAEVDDKLVGRLIRNLLRNSAEHAPSARRWIDVADDAGPAYGVFPFGKWDGAGQGLEAWTGKAYVVSDLAKDFPLTEPWQLAEERFEQPESFARPEDEDEWWDKLDAEHYPESLTGGWFPICHHGCALRTFLVVTGPERGHVWFDGRPEHGPVTPHEHEGNRLTFFEWYGAWLDKSLREVGA